jgi:type III restriction enzyme
MARSPVSKRASEATPILNGPYDEPEFHYATTTDGNLDYEDTRPGRRIFAPETPQVPLGKQPQAGMFDLNDFAAQYRDHIVNQLRFWFVNPARAAWQQLFYAQREAVETAIWLNEVAEKSNPGTHALNQLRLANETVREGGGDEASVLPRVAFKMATGTGKTVVMACLILYHYLNRSQYRNDPKYSDYFLLVAPGVTIRDRLSVLRVDTQALSDHDAADYYRQRTLVPPEYAGLLQGLNARIVITNYHSFEPRLISGNKRSPLDGKIGIDGKKVEAREDEALVFRRGSNEW